MRCLLLLAAMAVVPAFGCSAFVAASGRRLETYGTRAEVRRAFGTPAVQGEGPAYDEFKTHAKMSEVWKGEGLCIACVVTLGLSEVVALPEQLYYATRDWVGGHRVRFEYDADGKVTKAFLNGNLSRGMGLYSPPNASPDAKE